MRKLLVLILLAAGCMVGQISIRIGPPPPPRVVRVANKSGAWLLLGGWLLVSVGTPLPLA